MAAFISFGLIRFGPHHMAAKLAGINVSARATRAAWRAEPQLGFPQFSTKVNEISELIQTGSVI